MSVLTLNDFLKEKIIVLLNEWLPGGRVWEGEYICRGLSGYHGDGLRYDLKKMSGRDEATGVEIGDLVDLYCRVACVTRGDAESLLAAKYGYKPAEAVPASPAPAPSPVTEQEAGACPEPNIFQENPSPSMEQEQKPEPITGSDVSFDAGTPEAPDIAPSMSGKQLWDMLGIAVSGGGFPIVNIENILRVFECSGYFRNSIWFDEFCQRYYTTIFTGVKREWKDIDDLKLTAFLQREYSLLRVGDDVVHKAMRVFAHQDVRNEPKDWMESLSWDGVERVEEFFIQCAGSEDCDYVRAVGRNFFVSMVARVYSPGCQVDSMVILEGPQGVLKSTLLSVIGGNWHYQSTEPIHSKDFLQSLSGKLIVEFADLATWPKDDVDTLKKVITCRVDRYRQSYGRVPQDYPRTSVFAGTTNEAVYLHDDTGARRFWPIKVCGRIDIDRARRAREQLFAEAVTLYKAGSPWHLMPESTAAHQELRRQVDVWEDVLARKTEFINEVTPEELCEFLGLENRDRTKGHQMRIGKIMRKLGWDQFDIRKGSRISRVWRSQEKYPKTTLWVPVENPKNEVST